MTKQERCQKIVPHKLSNQMPNLVIISNSEEKQRKIPDPVSEGHTHMAMAKRYALLC